MTQAVFKLTVNIEPEQAPSATPQAAGDLDTSVITGMVIKEVPEQKFTLCVGYAARQPDVAVAADGFRDWASEDAVEKAAWSYLRKSPKVGLYHERQGISEGIAEVVESYVYRQDEPWVITAADGSQQTIYKGTWLIGLLWTDAGWDLVKQGEVRGLSPQGRARRRPTSPEDLATLRS